MGQCDAVYAERERANGNYEVVDGFYESGIDG